MKRILFLVYCLLMSSIYGQEVCNNALDDDGDGLIDLNDSDCECSIPLDEVTSLIPNPSFENRSCCPFTFSQLDCADNWEQASLGTSDYFNTCDYYSIMIPVPYTPVSLPLPGEPGGEGFVGFGLSSEAFQYKEYVGTCLLSSLMAGTEYTINLHTAHGNGEEALELALFGTPNCADLPWGSYECPLGYGDWEWLGSTDVYYSVSGEWQEVSITFTPAIDMKAIAIGANCDLLPYSDITNYYYLDGLILNTTESFENNLQISGDLCNDNFWMFPDTVGLSYQWYKNGVALVGEMNDSLKLNVGEHGLYNLVINYAGGCQNLERFVEAPIFPIANFAVDSVCFGDDYNLVNFSSFAGDDIIGWEWDFGDDGTAFVENPIHDFTSPGEYEIELVVTADNYCTDTLIVDLFLSSGANALFEFASGDFYSADGAIGGCIYAPIDFINYSTSDEMDAIIEWNWDFGDGTNATEENPSHLYSEIGLYTVTLEVKTELGCVANYEMEVMLTNGLIDVSSDTTICQNGTVTLVAVGDGEGEYTYDWSIPEASTDPVQIIEGLTENLVITVTATDEQGCISTEQSINVIVLAPLMLTEMNDTLICLDEFTSISPVVVGGDGDYSYAWQNELGDLVSTLPNLSVSPTESTTYCLTISDGCETNPVMGCVNVLVPNIPLFSVDNNSGCIPLKVEFSTVITDPSTVGFNWIINGGVYSTTDEIYNYIFNTSGNYTVVLETVLDEGCITASSITEYISVYPKPTASFRLTPNPTSIDQTVINLINDNIEVNCSYEWISIDAVPSSSTNTESVEVLFPIGVSGEYPVSLLATTINACKDTATATVQVMDEPLFFAANTFTPTDGGVNNQWKVFASNIDIYNYHLVVFNRWGEIVWESFDEEVFWNGKYANGVVVEDGTYVWNVVAKDQFTDYKYELNGTVNVLK